MSEQKRQQARRLIRAQRLRILRRRRRKKILCIVIVLAALFLVGTAIGIGLGSWVHTAHPEPIATMQMSTQAPTPIPTSVPTATPPPTPEPEPQLITITAVGDCTLGGNTNDGGDGEERFQDHFAENGPDYYLQNFRDLFENDDFTIVNLEGPLTNATDKRSGRTFNFRGEPEYVEILSGSGVEAATIANNHAYDFKTEGFEDTARVLEEAGIGACGFGLEYFTEVDGVTIGSLGFTEWDYEADEIESAVRAASEKCDLLIVSIHWGEELEEKHSKTTRRLGELIIDAGADLVIGNHSHIRGEIYRYNGKYIIYSLGNFCFGGNTRPTDMRCIVFQQSFCVNPDGTVEDCGINLIPARVSTNTKRNDLQPVWLEGDSAQKLLQEVYKLSNLTEEDPIWMPGSYVVQNGIVSENARIADGTV